MSWTIEQTQLLELAERAARRLREEKIGAGIKINKMEHNSVESTRTDGYRVCIGHYVKGGGKLYYYLDRYSGVLRFWYGFFAGNSDRAGKIYDSTKECTSSRKSFEITEEDIGVNGKVERLKRPPKLDLLVSECYPSSSMYFLGFYSGVNFPLKDPEAPEANELVRNSTGLFIRVGRKLCGDHMSEIKILDDVVVDTATSEKLSISCAKKYLKERWPKCKIIDRRRDICGYDLLVNLDSGEQYTVEVKGTKSKKALFCLSENEKRVMEEDRTRWRLLIVTDLKNKKAVEFYDADEVERVFGLRPYVWRGWSKS